MARRLEDVASQVDAILERGERREVLDLLALLAGRLALAQERVRDIRAGIQSFRDALANPPGRDLTVGEAVRLYPVSRSFLYERGAELGIVHRVDGSRKIVVNEAALRRVLQGKRA